MDPDAADRPASGAEDPAPLPGDTAPPPAPGERTRRGSRRRLGVFWGSFAVLMLAVLAFLVPWQYAYVPGESAVLNPTPASTDQAFDVWGRRVWRREADDLRKTPEGRAMLSPGQGAVATDAATLKLGRESFYAETFGNEVFLTDIVGAVSGPVRLSAVGRALWRLGGRGTTNLRVELAETATVGGRTFRRGEWIDTGLDVPRGAYAPLGMKLTYSLGRLRMGMTCAACHSTVDPATGRVIHGAPNGDLNAGLLLALATNSAAYFPHAEVADPAALASSDGPRVVAADGSRVPLPDPRALEDLVDATLLKWPPGGFDSMIDLVAAPTQLPTSFSRWNHPFAFSGPFAVGPFRGLSAQTNNVHALNSDTLAHADASPVLFGMDTEVYLATLLRRAADPRFRFDPATGRKPSAFFASVDPTPGTPGLNRVVVLPTYPKSTPIAPDSLFNGNPGRPVWQQVNAMAAWQDTIVPPKAPLAADPQSTTRGRQAFERAGCVRCHAGTDLTNHLVIPAPEVGTEPARAKALKKTGQAFAEPVAYAFDTPVPVPPGAKVLPVPATVTPDQRTLAFAHGDSPGGYKVPSLVGLYWTAPYLHDGGAAAGPDPETHIGLAGTLLAGVSPDPAESLRVLVDRALRDRAVASNRASNSLASVHVTGAGHEYWVDGPAGFGREDQDALIHYLLTYRFGKP